jgi:D-glycero-D-manno-heptose 1,7-bisphosphate phosphatase
MVPRPAMPAVFFDRDGVINEVVFRHGKPASPRSLEEFRLCGDIQQPLQELSAAGYRLFVVSNQPDVARGLLAPSVVDAISAQILALLPIERVLTCPHDDHDACACRKPKPGLLHELAQSEKLDLSRSFLVGDSWKDVRAGHDAGCTTILLQRDYNQGVAADYVVDNMAEAAGIVRGDLRHGHGSAALR